MLQQFLRTASDGWDLALASVRNLFAEADLHADEVGRRLRRRGRAARRGAAPRCTRPCAEHFPTDDAHGRRSRPSSPRAMTGRLDAALDVVPELAPYADALRATFDAVAELDGVHVQRIHGDLHLGQTLRTVKGWKIVDFEGEPAKPLAERVLPDSPWRDVAGMLRSFDYAAAGRRADRCSDQRRRPTPSSAPTARAEWAERNRDAFLDGVRRRAS